MPKKATNQENPLHSKNIPRPASLDEQSSNTQDNNSKTAIPQNSNTAKSGKTAKITIYPTAEQLDKLYEFMEAYRKRTGIRINQQDMIRRIIDIATLDTVLP